MTAATEDELSTLIATSEERLRSDPEDADAIVTLARGVRGARRPSIRLGATRAQRGYGPGQGLISDSRGRHTLLVETEPRARSVAK